MYIEKALTKKLFGIGHMYTYNFLLRMTDIMTSQNIDLSSWDTPYMAQIILSINYRRCTEELS
jgi:hypothetical protein